MTIATTTITNQLVGSRFRYGRRGSGNYFADPTWGSPSLLSFTPGSPSFVNSFAAQRKERLQE
jgi:hypothetical protein